MDNEDVNRLNQLPKEYRQILYYFIEGVDDSLIEDKVHIRGGAFYKHVKKAYSILGVPLSLNNKVRRRQAIEKYRKYFEGVKEEDLKKDDFAFKSRAGDETEEVVNKKKKKSKLLVIAIGFLGLIILFALALPRVLETTSVIFEEEFDGRLVSGWREVTGNYSIINGQLAAEGPVFMLVGSPNMRNYQVDISVKAGACWGERENAIGVNAQNANNMVALGFGSCISALFDITDGQWNEVTGSKRQIPGNHNYYQFRITSQGDRITVFESQQQRLFYISQNHQDGMVFIKLARGSFIDNVRITRLR